MTSSDAAQADAAFQEGLTFHKQSRLQEARSQYERALQWNPRHAPSLHLLGMIALQAGDAHRAVELIGKAITANATNPSLRNDHGVALYAIGRYEAAVESYDGAIALKADFAPAYYNRGNALLQLQRFREAIKSYEQAIESRPGYADAYYNRGNAFGQLRLYEAAISSYDEALACAPNHTATLINRATALRAVKRLDVALASLDRAISLTPSDALPYYNRGNVLSDLGQFDAAVKSYDQAIALRSHYPEAHAARATVLYALKQYEASISSFEAAIASGSSASGVRGSRLLAKLQICDWSELDRELADLRERIDRNEAAVPPFCALALFGEAALQKKVAELWVSKATQSAQQPETIPRRTRLGKLRIGYFSSDFGDHPVSRLMVEVLERHDRERVELTGFCSTADTGGELRERVKAAFDRFLDVRHMSDEAVASLAREMEIDVAVDLGGFTAGARPGIFFLRAAPVQVSYIGYLGTMGSACIDYILADRTIIPKDHQPHYTEKIIYLPSYQANDSRRSISDQMFSRAELGLPAQGFVYCCFNAPYKISQPCFAAWMRILERAKGSVLMLYVGNSTAEANLAEQVRRSGIGPDRVFFCRSLPLPEYLARLRAMDLFLDTLPYNAGTTASDALWAGLPVLTLAGNSFAGRIAASVLTSAGLPELVASSWREYEDMAVALAMQSGRMSDIRRKLKSQRSTGLLFDSRSFASRLETAFATAFDRWSNGLPTDHLHLSDT
jgi:predicted O-linked N-acetylglucosamine transferase (SPINDLY family)